MDKLLLDSHKLPYHPDRVADYLSGRAVWPLYAEISPTSRCNHRCCFCNFNHLGHAAVSLPQGRMPRLMDELGNAGVKAVVFAGSGEPSLHEDTFVALRRAAEIGLDTAMSTNGAGLREDQLREMAELLTWTRFSINGGTPESYMAVQGAGPEDLEKAFACLRKLADLKARTKSAITIGVQCVLTPVNKDTLGELGRRAREAGADYLSIKHFYHNPDNPYRSDMSFLTDDFLRRLRELTDSMSGDGFTAIARDVGTLKRNRPYCECAGLPFIVYIRENGILYTCFSHQDDPGTAVGNILEADFASLWTSPGKTASIGHINGNYDKNRCQANCRHHQVNLYLHALANPPAHVNFI